MPIHNPEETVTKNNLILRVVCIAVLVMTLCAFSSQVFAQEDANPAGAFNDDRDKSSAALSLSDLTDYNIDNTSDHGLSAHRYNYVLPFTYSTINTGRINKEVKFQFSVKQRIVRFYGFAAYLGLTQKSFWQLYDSRHSRPFRESNFNPEFFVRSKMWVGIRADIGIEHESNGQTELLSRSWNRVYLTPYYENEYVILSLKSWFRIKEKKKTSPDDTEGDDNPDMQKYTGYNEFGITVKFAGLNNLYISTIGRYNFVHNKGSIEANVTFPGIIKNMSVMVQYFEGYGESLIDYNVRQRKAGIGFSVTR
jgi:phospholipase A1